MTQPAARCLLLLAASFAAWQPSKARAADEDSQFWLNTVATGKIGDGTTLTLDASQRWRSAREVGADQQTIRIAIDEQVGENTRIGGGVMLVEAAGLTELRTHQQASFTLGRIEARTRLEQRFFDGADRMELRLRQRVQYGQPLAKDWRATAGVEWLGLLQGRRSGQGASTEQWRMQASLIHRLSKNLDVGAIYWLVIFPRGARPAKTSHIPQAAITYRF
ncbi:DUF2490 domain-containing protein [Erythrobacter cryptus]|uniref:DUF2490 domain-containing protein n=1 Tax=Erythrobacter cryptus TaxID=196588 RepID=UPI00041E9580|nr:DUF2490 domain-containing protein [Erythrobacter cryptus]GIX20623.1 MAG: hypothetical protein KatS3mg120_2299 [Erythrobacter sp.]